MGKERHTTILSRAALASGVALALAAVPTRAALTVSVAATKNVTCSGDTCKATARNAILNVSDLASDLASSNITLVPGKMAKDIRIAAHLTWASGNSLTLDSFHSIVVEKRVAVTGTGGLAIKTNDGGAGGDYSFSGKGAVDFHELTSVLVINGGVFTLVGDIATLASDIASNASGNYALAANYDASGDGTYSAPPVNTNFTGQFEGLGNSISHLTVAATSKAGLFGSPHGLIRDLGLRAVKMSAGNNGTSGGLAAIGFGTVMNTYVTGKVTVGSGAIDAGGLMGVDEGTVINSWSSVSVKGGDSNGGAIGGLVGETFSAAHSISDSYATGRVTGGKTIAAGGLMGANATGWTVTVCHASGSVSGKKDLSSIGGLIGFNGGTISQCYATGSVSGGGNDVVGGLVGYNNGTMSQSYATGSIIGGDHSATGGFVGFNAGTIENSYAFGSSHVSTDGSKRTFVGGLVGFAYSGSISSVYSTGAPTSTGSGVSLIGGLLGRDFNPGNLSSAYWDMDTSSITDPSKGAGKPRNDPGITGLSDATLKSGLPAGFDSLVWGQDAGINDGYPYLLANPPP